MPGNRVMVVGSVNTDLVIRGRRLPRPGETILGGSFYQAAGGKGANQAVGAARAAVQPVTFLAAVGDDDFGSTALAGFRRENLDTAAIRVVAGAATGVALILVDYPRRRRLKILGHAHAVTAEDDPALLRRLEVEGYRAKVERGLIIAVAAFDWNCPQHITPRFTEAEIVAAVAPLHARIAELEAALAQR